MKGLRARRPVTTAAAVVTVPAVVAVLALLNPGFPLARVELNDGAVWLTATELSKLGRYNVQVDELNGGLVAQSTTFDVLQDEGDVVLVEPGKVSIVDPATVALTSQVTAAGVQPSFLPGGAVSMSAGVLSLVDGEGGLCVRQLLVARLHATWRGRARPRPGNRWARGRVHSGRHVRRGGRRHGLAGHRDRPGRPRAAGRVAGGG